MWGLRKRFGCRVKGVGSRVQGQSLGCGVWGLRFGVWGLGFGVWGLGEASQVVLMAPDSAVGRIDMPLLSHPEREEEK